jgi:ankyrin repeat protein
LINAGHQIDSLDRFKRTPLFFAIRNNNHAVTYELLKNGAKYYKKDTSLNSLLHYCAAYGNTLFLQHLLPHMKINKNKQKYYPW